MPQAALMDQPARGVKCRSLAGSTEVTGNAALMDLILGARAFAYCAATFSVPWNDLAVGFIKTDHIRRNCISNRDWAVFMSRGDLPSNKNLSSQKTSLCLARAIHSKRTSCKALCRHTTSGIPPWVSRKLPIVPLAEAFRGLEDEPKCSRLVHLMHSRYTSVSTNVSVRSAYTSCQLRHSPPSARARQTCKHVLTIYTGAAPKGNFPRVLLTK